MSENIAILLYWVILRNIMLLWRGFPCHTNKINKHELFQESQLCSIDTIECCKIAKKYCHLYFSYEQVITLQDFFWFVLCIAKTMFWCFYNLFCQILNLVKIKLIVKNKKKFATCFAQQSLCLPFKYFRIMWLLK